jgi:hypothetical protein
MRMTTTDTPTASTDPTLAVAERQLAMLTELAALAMNVTRTFAAAAEAASKAEAQILSEPWFTPEVGRARACGAKEASESFQKVTRALRLTMILEKSTAEWLRDIRNGTASTKDAGGTPALRLNPRAPRRSAGVPAGSSSPDRDRERCECDKERLDVERPDRLPRAPFRETVDAICADVGATVDWPRWKVRATKVSFGAGEPLLRPDHPAAPEPEAALPP